MNNKEEEGGNQMTNPSYNVITAKSMGTMNLNEGRSKRLRIQAKHMSQIMKEKPQMGCFSLATSLKNNIRTYGC